MNITKRMKLFLVKVLSLTADKMLCVCEAILSEMPEARW